MDTLYKHSVAALVVTALALGCGSSDQQRQQAKAPSSSMSSTTEVTGSTTPLQPSAGGGGPQDTTGLPTSSQNAEQNAVQNAEQNAEPTSTTTTMPATIDSNVTTLSDGEVFAIESALNKGEITLADLAKKKAASGEVKTFAAMVATHHRDAQAKASAVAQKEKIAAAADDASKKLESDASATVADLRDRKGREFDTSYIDSQVRMHRDAGTLIDTQLLPSAKNAALQDQLTILRTAIAGHLTKAQEIQSHLEAVGASSAGSEPAKNKAKSTGKTKGTAPAPKMSP